MQISTSLNKYSKLSLGPCLCKDFHLLSRQDHSPYSISPAFAKIFINHILSRQDHSPNLKPSLLITQHSQIRLQKVHNFLLRKYPLQLLGISPKIITKVSSYIPQTLQNSDSKILRQFPDTL